MSLHPWRAASLVVLLCTGATGNDADPPKLRLTQTRITIPQVDYEPALHSGAGEVQPRKCSAPNGVWEQPGECTQV